MIHFSLSRGLRTALLTVSFLVAVAAGTSAQAQDVNARLQRLEQTVQRLQGQPAGAAAPASGMSPSDIESRLLSLERAIELLTGQVEEARFKSDRSAEQIKTLSDDLNLRVATLEQSLGMNAPTAPAPLPSAPRASAEPAPGAVASSAPVGQSLPAPAAAGVNAGQGDAGGVAANGGFVMRTDASGKPLPPDPNAPPPPAAAAAAAAPPSAPVPRAAPAGAAVTSNSLAAIPVNVTLPQGTPKEQYDFAFDFLKRNDYARGESALRQFLQAHPKDALAANAQYWLGETFYVRGNYQQAATEFLVGYQNFPKGGKGADSLLKLGLSLEKLDKTDGACTAFGRITKDYPDATDQVKGATKTERTKLKCK